MASTGLLAPAALRFGVRRRGAFGNLVPPMFIYPRVHFKNHMLTGAPTVSIAGAPPTGWSNQRLFGDYLQHFFACERPCKEDLVLLILDNFESHLLIPAINMAKENGILLLTLPPHTSRKLEPLDCTVFGPYKTYYNACLNDWILSNPGKPVAMYSVAGIIGKIFSKEFTKHSIEKSFHVTGIYPLNASIFGEDEFLSSYVTDRPYSRVTEPAIAPSSSKDDNEEGASAGFVKVSPEIRPFPKAGPKK